MSRQQYLLALVFIIIGSVVLCSGIFIQPSIIRCTPVEELGSRCETDGLVTFFYLSSGQRAKVYCDTCNNTYYIPSIHGGLRDSLDGQCYIPTVNVTVWCYTTNVFSDWIITESFPFTSNMFMYMIGGVILIYGIYLIVDTYRSKTLNDTSLSEVLTQDQESIRDIHGRVLDYDEDTRILQ
jgi:hypothetical protein